MPEHQLERVIVDFLEQKFPVLVCSTIVESGIDMPNVNTLIVNRADRFGLAQLYQIRGRVGRSTVQAYAYFLTPGDERLSDEARHRLDVLSAHQELGAGFQIASHDLELRGAGNLLGAEQSGQVAEVGLELYTEMLEAAINEIRGEAVREKVDTEIKLPVTALIPADYIKSENQRLHLYKSLFSAESEEELVSLRTDTIDRFGPLPPDLGRLFRVASLKQLLRIVGATVLSASSKGFWEIRFGSLKPAQIDRILKVVQKHPTKYRLSPDYKLFMYGEVMMQPKPNEQDLMLTNLIGLVQPLAQELEAN
jgi:transcription-repair coupling factor (superfamily II helicase)